MLERFLIIWLVLLSALAYSYPQPFEDTIPFFPYIIAVTMFAIGALLPKDEIITVISNWPKVLGGTCIQYLAMPLLAYSLAHLFQLPEHYRIGMIMAGCVPGAMASNVITLAARGNVSYSVSLTTSATLLSPIVVPIILYLAFDKTESPYTLLSKAFDLFLTVVIPVICGYLCAQYFVKWDRMIKWGAPRLANLSILWIVAAVVGANRENIVQGLFATITPLLLLNLLGYLSGYLGGTLLRLDFSMRRALTLEVGMQNAGLGTALVTSWFQNQPEATIPTAIYTFGCMITGLILAQTWRTFDRLKESKTAKELNSQE